MTLAKVSNFLQIIAISQRYSFCNFFRKLKFKVRGFVHSYKFFKQQNPLGAKKKKGITVKHFENEIHLCNSPDLFKHTTEPLTDDSSHSLPKLF